MISLLHIVMSLICFPIFSYKSLIYSQNFDVILPSINATTCYDSVFYVKLQIPVRMASQRQNRNRAGKIEFCHLEIIPFGIIESNHSQRVWRLKKN